VILKTATSIYEVRTDQKTFRRIHEFGRANTNLPLGQWYRFQRMSPVVIGEPVRFFWVLGEEGGVARIGLWATSPVLEVLEDDPRPDGSSFLLPERRAGNAPLP
jgi:hypothetical protein